MVSAFDLDSVLIFLSYVVILCSVLAIASQEERLKTLNTYVSHLSTDCVHGSSIGKHAPKYVHMFMSLVYLFVPLMLNPIIYSIKTKEMSKRYTICYWYSEQRENSVERQMYNSCDQFFTSEKSKSIPESYNWNIYACHEDSAN
ncbi:hypothetical protein HPG69_005718 [Diceros bicornis minor]|uniref:G-protein coupled receptors family 1 profile domain-containing protein n=1 Tax=Diceros bicornis minor TaxID=77932 RepID=A0A7J7ESB9_DICBM|nr:hypothetical protein HPG69_005718 [Diceros bicornis minor]